jgi:PncC family amidohydrolase
MIMQESYEVVAGQLLHRQGLKLAVAESCTGGLISDLVTNIAGSSEYFINGIIAYSYEAKEQILGVRHETLAAYGAVSRETVLEMAHCARFLLSDQYPPEKVIGISASGIAGPGGGMPNKPVGLVWIGLSTPTGDWARAFYWKGNRVENKVSSAQAGLRFLIEYLEGNLT